MTDESIAITEGEKFANNLNEFSTVKIRRLVSGSTTFDKRFVEQVIELGLMSGVNTQYLIDIWKLSDADRSPLVNAFLAGVLSVINNE